MEAAYPRRWRPTRYGLAALLGGAVLLLATVSSILSFLVSQIPARASLFGLPAVALVAAATYFGVRGFQAHQEQARRRDRVRAVVLLGAGMVLWLLVLDVFTFTQAAGPRVALLSALACLPTTAFGLFVVRRLDRNEKEPWRLVLVATVWGAIVSTSLVVWAETIWDYFAVRSLVPGPALNASIAYSAGIFEETSKGIAVVLLYLIMRDDFDDVVDGIVYGAAVGLGFNFMESITYMTHLYAIFQPEGQGLQAAAAQWYSRQALGLFFGHAAYTALIGAGVGIARQLPRPGQRILSILCGFLIAIAAHFAWDAWVQFYPVSQSPFALVEIHLRTLFMEGPFVALVLLLLAMGLHLEGSALRRQLSAEAKSGTGAVEDAEVTTLVSPWRRFRARLRRLGRQGLFGYLRLGRLQSAQLDLAMERWHRERNEVDEPMEAEEHLRRRVLELRAAAG
jgi:RsiW-degrading membrane proteinase PrsW (M82 family)